MRFNPAKRALRLICLCVVALTTANAGNSSEGVNGPVAGSPESEAIIFERQQTMMQLDRDSETLGNIVAGIDARSKLGETTRSIAQGAKESLENFRKQNPGGRAKPEVWSNYADFMQRMEAFTRNADAMAAAGEKGNVAAVTGMMIEALPCKECHDLYRERKQI